MQDDDEVGRLGSALRAANERNAVLRAQYNQLLDHVESAGVWPPAFLPEFPVLAWLASYVAGPCILPSVTR